MLGYEPAWKRLGLPRTDTASPCVKKTDFEVSAANTHLQPLFLQSRATTHLGEKEIKWKKIQNLEVVLCRLAI